MRQTAMDRWIEAAEANRFCLVVQQRRDRPTEQTLLSASLLLMRLRSMAQPQTSHQCQLYAAVTRSSASA
jgi:hypothetical protein